LCTAPPMAGPPKAIIASSYAERGFFFMLMIAPVFIQLQTASGLATGITSALAACTAWAESERTHKRDEEHRRERDAVVPHHHRVPAFVHED